MLMANRRPSRPKQSLPKPSYGTTNSSDTDKQLGVQENEHAHHSALRETLEGLGNKIKAHRDKVEADREKKANENLASERSFEVKRKVQAENDLKHEQKLDEIRKVEQQVAELKKARFDASLTGRTINLAKRTAKVVGHDAVVIAKTGYALEQKFEKYQNRKSSRSPRYVGKVYHNSSGRNVGKFYYNSSGQKIANPNYKKKRKSVV